MSAVQLCTSLSQRRVPLVLIHGLDSSQDTFAAACARFAASGQPFLTLDLRGHGQSPLGAEADFSSAALVADIHAAVRHHGIARPFALLGHSMGGRVAVSYAAAHPADLAALLIEDIDLVPRDYSSGSGGGGGGGDDGDDAGGMAPLRAFRREFATWEACAAALRSFGYEGARIEGWREAGRIFARPDGTWWSSINPLARHLACAHVLATGDARAAFAQLAAGGAGGGGGSGGGASCCFPVHLLVAGRDSACEEGGIEEMSALMPRMCVRRFEGAGHSIHACATEEFLDYVGGAIAEVS
jgi:pimeloyl-ACP methyl ester carboxylesterase